MEEFVHSRRDLLVVGVAFGLVVGLLALGFGLAAGMPASKSGTKEREKPENIVALHSHHLPLSVDTSSPSQIFPLFSLKD